MHLSPSPITQQPQCEPPITALISNVLETDGSIPPFGPRDSKRKEVKYATAGPHMVATLAWYSNAQDDKQPIQTFRVDWANGDRGEEYEYLNDSGFGVTWPLRKRRFEQKDGMKDELVETYDGATLRRSDSGKNAVPDDSSFMMVMKAQGKRGGRFCRQLLSNEHFSPPLRKLDNSSPLHPDGVLMLVEGSTLTTSDFQAWAARIRERTVVFHAPNESTIDSSTQTKIWMVDSATQTDVLSPLSVSTKTGACLQIE